MKKIILSIAVIATAAIAGWKYQQNKQSIVLSDLALENVEALARIEGAGDACDNFTQMTCVSVVVGGGGGVYPDMYPSDAL